MFIFVGGIPGVGKTSIIEGLISKLNSSGNKTEGIYGLPILCKLAGNISAEEFRKLPDRVRDQYRPEMLRRIYERDKNDPSTIRIVDGHFAYFETEGRRGFSTRSVNSEDYERIKAIFIIESNPEEILERRKRDSGERTDRALDIDYIREQLEIERNEATNQAKKLGIPIVFIDNGKKLEDAIREIYIEVTKTLKLPCDNSEIKSHKIKLS